MPGRIDPARWGIASRSCNAIDVAPTSFPRGPFAWFRGRGPARRRSRIKAIDGWLPFPPRQAILGATTMPLTGRKAHAYARSRCLLLVKRVLSALEPKGSIIGGNADQDAAGRTAHCRSASIPMSGLHPLVSLRFRGVRWHTRKADCDRLAGWLNRHFPAVLNRPEALLKCDVGSRVAEAEGWVIKEAAPRRGRPFWRFGFRRSGARRVFHLAEALARRRIPTPRAIAWATVRRWGVRRRDYLIAECLRPGMPLRICLDRHRSDPGQLKGLLLALGEILGSFHSAGYSNRDLKDTNLLVVPSPAFRLWVVDLDGTRRLFWVPRCRAIRDFRPIVRSLRQHGILDPDVWKALCEGYNAVVPRRLRRATLSRVTDGFALPSSDPPSPPTSS